MVHRRIVQAAKRYQVKVYKRGDRNRWQLQAVDLSTKKPVKYRTLPKSIRREAEAVRIAAKWEDELEEAGLFQDVGWPTARDRFEREYFGGLSDDYCVQWGTVYRKIDALTPPTTIWEMDASWVSAFAADLADSDLAPASIRTYLRVLGVFMNWAARIFPGYRPPQIDMPAGGNDMKGRPICGEELDRMLAKTASVVGKTYAGDWQFLIEGLYLSGLRRGEALRLRWDAPAGREFHVRHLGNASRRPVFVIPSADDKGRKAREFPIAPDFAAFLEKVPPEHRHGFVFNPELDGGRVTKHTVTAKVMLIGRAAGVVVGDHLRFDPETGKKVRVPSYASPHDLRRSFGDRWSMIVPEMALMDLMRHSSIETTRRYYRGKNAQATADSVWEHFERLQRSQRPAGEQHGGDSHADREDYSMDSQE